MFSKNVVTTPSAERVTFAEFKRTTYYARKNSGKSTSSKRSAQFKAVAAIKERTGNLLNKLDNDSEDDEEETKDQVGEIPEDSKLIIPDGKDLDKAL